MSEQVLTLVPLMPSSQRRPSMTSIRISYLSDWPMQARGLLSVQTSVVYFTPSMIIAGWNSVASVVPSPVGAEASLM